MGSPWYVKLKVLLQARSQRKFFETLFVSENEKPKLPNNSSSSLAVLGILFWSNSTSQDSFMCRVLCDAIVWKRCVRRNDLELGGGLGVRDEDVCSTSISSNCFL